MYTAIFLDEKSHKILLKKYNVPEGWKIFGDHMTIKMGKVPTYLEPFLGNEYSMTINSVGKSKSNIAFGVKTKLSKNKRPHITLAVDMKNGKPVDSNKIVDWFDIPPFKVTGILSEK